MWKYERALYIYLIIYNLQFLYELNSLGKTSLTAVHWIQDVTLLEKHQKAMNL